MAAAEFGDATEAAAGFSALVGLLPLVAWHGLDQAANLWLLSGTGGLVADAAAWAIIAGKSEQAVELLEQGRSVLWTQTIQLRSETDELALAYPDLAARLDMIRALLDRSVPSIDAELTIEARDRRVVLAHDWDQLIDGIRRLPGFESFLRPPLFDTLAAALRDRPVAVINISSVRCDAIVVTGGQAHIVPLPRLDAATAEMQSDAYRAALDSLNQPPETGTDSTFDERRDTLRQASARQKINSILAWLWDTVAQPVLDTLGFIADVPTIDSDDMPRLWWSPTRSLTLLPLHAAGHHNAAAAGRSVIDNVVSSYTPTLRALYEASTSPTTPTTSRILVAAMPVTPGGVTLPSAEAEAAVVGRLFPERTVLIGAEATVDDVLAALPHHRYVHFACHCEIVRPPFDSGLALHDGRLTIGSLSRHRFPTAALAFLAACSTAAYDDLNPDEAITVATAMHLSGFQHVIAAMGVIFDDQGPAIAQWIYTSLRGADNPSLRLDRAAHAVHKVTRQLRDDGHPPTRWAIYTHTGP